ncbi:hypothetical protein AC578_1529 [Pseudocercospora eumusae]|uniref:Uncharacterized protein n=1 Tax=Pseudocercospora eumusae TaxID=321146 RepID=A0A139GXW0_9PEZI|nr:hypothetical protein AC578_1529 [Pseudocercospora eumusae]
MRFTWLAIRIQIPPCPQSPILRYESAMVATLFSSQDATRSDISAAHQRKKYVADDIDSLLHELKRRNCGWGFLAAALYSVAVSLVFHAWGLRSGSRPKVFDVSVR